MIKKAVKKHFKVLFILFLVFAAALIILMPFVIPAFFSLIAIILNLKIAVFFKKIKSEHFDVNEFKQLKCYVTGCSDIFNFSDKKRFSFDENLIINYNLSDAQKNQYNPAYVGYQALLSHELFLKTENSKYINIFDNCIKWIYENKKKDCSGNTIWEYSFDYDEGGKKISAPWSSCIASAFCISALLRKYKMSGEIKFCDIAVNAAENFFVKMGNGGYLYSDDANGIYFLEEYPVDKPVHIFDGFIFALISVYELYLTTGNLKYIELFDKCVYSVKRNFNIFDFYGIWSNYGNYSILSTDSYHNINKLLVEAIYKITGDDFFGKKAQAWGNFKTSFLLKMLILNVYYVKYIYFIIKKNWNNKND